jgi:hypothetical protein
MAFSRSFANVVAGARRDGRDDHFLPNSGKKRETLEINS